MKACTLCEGGVAMFPDAPTQRGVKHLLRLAELVRSGSFHGEKIVGGKVIFVIGFPSPRVFLPNIHTDPIFAQTLSTVSSTLDLHACSVGVTPLGIARLANLHVPIRLDPAELAARNGGVYLLLIKLNNKRTIATGGLGKIAYPAGWYVYVGSAKRGLASRVGRHLRKKKTLRWHIDYLTIIASKIVPFPIYTDQDLECNLAMSVNKAGGRQIHRFGSSDCSCDSHLFWFAANPMETRDFVDVIFTFRHRYALQNFL